MAVENEQQHDSPGAWAKRYHLANRAAIEAILRPYDLGSTQWYVLHRLSHDGPTMQRDLTRALQVERATLSAIVATLVRKGLIEQSPHSVDQRQRVLELSPAGRDLWDGLPDPIALTQAVSFSGVDADELATTVRVLRAATRRLTESLSAES